MPANTGRLFYKEYGRDAYGHPVEAVADELTHQGDTVRGRSHERPHLLGYVWAIIERYDDLNYLSRETVAETLGEWWTANELKGEKA